MLLSDFICLGWPLLVCIVFLLLVMKWDTTQRHIQQEAKEQEQKYCLDIDKALSMWLLSLELPQLASKTKREEIATQLRTVLTEKLLLQQLRD